jgi:hypothetical protein
MSERTVYTEEQAALLDAHAKACALSQRYAHACDEILGEGDLRDRLDARRRQLEETSASLESRIRTLDLLPHDINVDREDMARLADRFREWLDSERHARIRNALATREAELIECFEALQTHGQAEAIDHAKTQARQMTDWLQSD